PDACAVDPAWRRRESWTAGRSPCRWCSGQEKVLLPTGGPTPGPCSRQTPPRPYRPAIEGLSSRAQRGICLCSPNRALAALGMTIRNAACSLWRLSALGSWLLALGSWLSALGSQVPQPGEKQKRPRAHARGPAL